MTNEVIQLETYAFEVIYVNMRGDECCNRCFFYISVKSMEKS